MLVFSTLQPKSKWFLKNVHQKADSLDSRHVDIVKVRP